MSRSRTCAHHLRPSSPAAFLHDQDPKQTPAPVSGSGPRPTEQKFACRKRVPPQHDPYRLCGRTTRHAALVKGPVRYCCQHTPVRTMGSLVSRLAVPAAPASSGSPFRAPFRSRSYPVRRQVPRPRRPWASQDSASFRNPVGDHCGDDCPLHRGKSKKTVPYGHSFAIAHLGINAPQPGELPCGSWWER